MFHSRALSKLTPIEQNVWLDSMIEMENKYQKLYTNFCLNPYRKLHHITEKPTTIAEDESSDFKHFECLVKKSDKLPKEKYEHTITTSHEYGWHCPKPYNPDVKFHFPIKKSGLELYMMPKK